jgi:hypothetical protein
MPEFMEFSEEQMDKHAANVKAFEQFLENLPDDVSLFDLDNFEVIMYCRLRSIMTLEQLHQRAHILIQKAEAMLHTEGVFTDEHGNPINPILRENFESLDDLNEMMGQLRTNISDDDLTALLSEGEEE